MGREVKDGIYYAEDIDDAFNDDFVSEKDLCEFIERNIKSFISEIGFEYSSHKREVNISNTKKRRGRGSKRLDFSVTTSCGKLIVIECKRPTYKCEMHSGIGQILSYLTILELQGIVPDKVILLSTKIDSITALMISKFNLPIDFIVMDKTKFCIWQDQQNIALKS